jgi:epoxyqueuosine reductase
VDDLYKQSSMIKAEARRIGFDGCGISKAGELSDDSVRLSDWLQKGFHATMSYMENHFEKRVNPTKLVEDARSVISVILNYFPSKGQEDQEAPVISKYAYGKDYHGVIKRKLKVLLEYINTSIKAVKGRGFVDSAPVLDRAWAARSGLGWIGKNSMLISPAQGSFFFIGTLIVDIELFYDRPIPDFCGDCTRCINACPTKAIVAPRIIDSGKCISYHTIENKGEIDVELKGKFQNRAFGCDICQDVCPWNRKAIPNSEEDFQPLPGLLEMKKDEWYDLSEKDFNVKFEQSPLKRAKYAGLKRNFRFLVP